ncbi:MAG: hypothetical protein CMF96_05645 [Candidatus Marinimicrobia bacterium]|nr:hypothetical protein [Candidatus Neomarinimicrobiota bacterium]|tara:strand:- start:4164 stop:4565 length:402 start_codon:yes stop_codon:yes gene_type:complete
MLDILGFIIKLIFGCLLGGICKYDKKESFNEITSIFTGAMIGAIGTISTSFSLSLNIDNYSVLLGFMIISSIFTLKIILDQNNEEIGIRELFSLIVGWFVGVGNILHAIILTIFLIFFLIRFSENKEDDLDNI